MCLGDCFSSSSWAENTLMPKHLRYLRSLHLRTDIPPEILQVDSHDLVPFTVVQGGVNIVDVRLKPVSGGLIDELFLVRRGDDYYSVLRSDLAEFGFYLSEDLVAVRVSSPEHCIGLIQEQYAGAFLPDEGEQVLDSFLGVTNVVGTAHQFSPSNFDEANTV